MRPNDNGESHTAILAALREARREELDDPDDGPLFWLAVAQAQWDCGALSPKVLARVTTIVKRGYELDRWIDGEPRLLKQRQVVLTAFLEKIQHPRPKPRKRHKRRTHHAPYAAGTCLAMKLPDGDYGAALVLAAGETGLNLVGVLRYKSAKKPTPSIFKRRRWLRLTHHAWRCEEVVQWCMPECYRQAAQFCEPVGQVELQPEDPQTSRGYCDWELLPHHVVNQYRWESGDHDW